MYFDGNTCHFQSKFPTPAKEGSTFPSRAQSTVNCCWFAREGEVGGRVELLWSAYNAIMTVTFYLVKRIKECLVDAARLPLWSNFCDRDDTHCFTWQRRWLLHEPGWAWRFEISFVNFTSSYEPNSAKSSCSSDFRCDEPLVKPAACHPFCQS